MARPKGTPPPPPKRKTAERVEGIKKEDIDRLTQEIWLPILPSLMAIHAEAAMEDSKLGFIIREAILDRVFGKPTQKVEEKAERTISIVIRPDTTPDPNALANPGVDEGVQVVEGEATPLPVLQAPSLPSLSFTVTKGGPEEEDDDGADG